MHNIKKKSKNLGMPLAVRRDDGGVITHILFEGRERAMSLEAAIGFVKKGRVYGVKYRHDNDSAIPLELVESIVGTTDFEDIPEL